MADTLRTKDGVAIKEITYEQFDNLRNLGCEVGWLGNSHAPPSARWDWLRYATRDVGNDSSLWRFYVRIDADATDN